MHQQSNRTSQIRLLSVRHRYARARRSDAARDFPIIRRLCAEPNVVGLEIVELAPLMDPTYVSARNANRTIRECLTGVAMRKKGITEPDCKSPLTVSHGQGDNSLSAGVGATLALVWASGARAEPHKVIWADLREGRPQACRSFLEGYLNRSDCAEQVVLGQLMPSRFVQCGPGNAALDGKEITIAGYAHPPEFEFSGVTEFLLIPLPRQDCRHPPPPMPDQVVSVEFPGGIDVTADPIRVTGVLRLQSDRTHIAPYGYALEATGVAPAVIPDVAEGRQGGTKTCGKRILVATLPKQAAPAPREVGRPDDEATGILWKRLRIEAWIPGAAATARREEIWAAAWPLVAERCTACQQRRIPDHYTANQWRSHIRIMGPRTGLPREQQMLILAFLQHHASDTFDLRSDGWRPTGPATGGHQ